MAISTAAFRRALLIAVIFVVVLSVLVPAEWISVLRHRWWWFTYPLDHIENVQSAVNLVHAILFFLLGMATRLALPNWRFGRIALSLLLLGIATELLQVLVPGRHPRLSDVVVDVVAGLFGWMVIWGIGVLGGRLRG